MKCPFCQHDDSSVLESRESEDGQVTRRRRECGQCSKRFTSYERVEGPQLLVIKKNGGREQFDREKVRRGVARACEKRPVSSDLIGELVDQLEQEMLKKSVSEVASRVIGNAILKRLKKIDKVAYVRFASVYLDFNEIDDFARLVKEIK
ncbi:transcriptional regulator NrdR [Candidatus Beckwithbacteria bacterium CG22_combo_CG10-13_8_21_14_all_01_47_9]|uniref:Transcriptional repressor NrdR n=5 Tax=Candidatus Beckwithiibacteriota TaxID=1752726 RepID=A0A2H0E1W1_9BACT|nr:MAG: transcriptional regulator NrdR [Candidatus Beckwithbacteria bacterium CG1_02_47_37]PIP52378.1 MAG: transcriptional regulator NrdR [Candidatus Beckwithbacteria bacterium CG23_combo_of_CG06-09_8_20_14_all_47_9]PIP88422.1 MAG: transcriptional regulator NrdR [Candidatus Beckwithbacteria bacterium CG22_combo_CG10-13_8_21_14_all_01_47_9]PJA21246.1 MAG: transcriptional regulator NrdR [Candidatus Beckwithbacteria bacterium CG_4_10_14_0_2_um_filter_47_25]PJC66274.1 MAG: transcriptional regulator